MSEKRLYVKLFGKFEITYDGQEVTLGRNQMSKNVRLFQIMAAFYEEGISRGLLMDYLFGDEEVADRANSLRVCMHRLRKIMVTKGIMEGECFLLEDGIYHWAPEITLNSDVMEFLSNLNAVGQETESKRKIERLMKVWDSYTGEFLQDIGAEQWAIVRAVEYKSRYTQAMHELIELLRSEKDYRTMLEVSGQISRLYPYDEWQVVEIESLVELKRVREAINLYHQTVRRYYDDLGIDLPKEMADKINRLSSALKDTPDILEDIREKLTEGERSSGGIYLSPPSFIDTLRLMVRIAERSGQDICLMVCIFKEDNDHKLTNREHLDKMSLYLREAIQTSLRRGDSYTNYDDGQFLLLLVGTQVPQCELIFQRIYGTFRKKCKTWDGTLHYYVTDIMDMDHEDAKVRLTRNEFSIDENI